jgi:cobalamin biosynthesis protein CobT
VTAFVVRRLRARAAAVRAHLDAVVERELHAGWRQAVANHERSWSQ